MSSMRATVLAWGNTARGDDAAGPYMAQAIRRRPHRDILLIEDCQLQVEYLLDCQAAPLLLFLDARAGADSGMRFEEVKPLSTVSHTSHSLTPAELLGYYGRTFAGERPPPAFELTVAGRCFELGKSMSAATRSDCEQAVELIEHLLEQPEPHIWRQLAHERATA